MRLSRGKRRSLRPRTRRCRGGGGQGVRLGAAAGRGLAEMKAGTRGVATCAVCWQDGWRCGASARARAPAHDETLDGVEGRERVLLEALRRSVAHDNLAWFSYLQDVAAYNQYGCGARRQAGLAAFTGARTKTCACARVGGRRCGWPHRTGGRQLLKGWSCCPLCQGR